MNLFYAPSNIKLLTEIFKKPEMNIMNDYGGSQQMVFLSYNTTDIALSKKAKLLIIHGAREWQLPLWEWDLDIY